MEVNMRMRESSVGRGSRYVSHAYPEKENQIGIFQRLEPYSRVTEVEMQC